MTHFARPPALLAALILTAVLTSRTEAHPGTGIVVDRQGQVYFVDMVNGVWKLDTKGALTHMPGLAFHWMTMDAADRFATTRLPQSSSGDMTRIGRSPTLILASDFPLALGTDGNLYYPTHTGAPVKIMQLLQSGETKVHATLAATNSKGPLLDINGLAAGPDGSLYFSEDSAIRRIARDGRVTTLVENVTLQGCPPSFRGLDVDAAGTVYVAATGCNKVVTIAPDGKIGATKQVKEAWPPTGVALFGKAAYVLEFEKKASEDRREMLPRIRKISADGATAVVGTVTRHPPRAP